MASELVSLNAGALTVVNRGRIGGITFRDVMPSHARRRARAGERARPGAHGVHGALRRALSVRRPTARSRPTPTQASRSRTRRSRCIRRGSSSTRRRPSTSRSWSTSSPTSGSATASPRTAGATCGSTRATPPGTSSSTARRSTREFYDFEDADPRASTARATGGGRSTGRWPRRSAPTTSSTCSTPTSTAAARTVLFALQAGRRGPHVLRDRAPLGRALRGRVRLDGRLHRAGLQGRPPQPRPVPARLALRLQDAADAGPSGLDRQRARRRAHGARGRQGADRGRARAAREALI